MFRARKRTERSTMRSQLNGRDVIQPGMRVVVPFGPRQIQGFVVEIVAESSHDKTKPIHDVLDVFPVLTKELLTLGDWLAEHTLCFKLSAYQLMVPAALRTKVKKELIVMTKIDELSASLQDLFKDNEKIEWSELIKRDKTKVKEVQQAVKAGILEVRYQVEEKGKKKTERFIRLA